MIRRIFITLGITVLVIISIPVILYGYARFQLLLIALENETDVNTVKEAILPGAGYSHESTSMEEIRIVLGKNDYERILYVPRAYINLSSNLSGGEQPFLQIAAHWSDMQPISIHWQKNPIPNERNRQRQKIYSDELLEIELRAGAKGRQVFTKETGMVRVTRGSQIIDALENNPHDFQWTEYGLYRYVGPPAVDENGHPRIGHRVAGQFLKRGDEMYVTDPRRGDPAIHFRCSKKLKEMGRLFCYGDTGTDFGLSIRYRMRTNRLAEWKDIDQSCRKLSKSFLHPEKSD